ncbi:MAG: 50S ribosomal protein L4, partial [Actinobacteria bacterium]|nr:50S ribosomal protein L4 [Actinomycetota bacterium]
MAKLTMKNPAGKNAASVELSDDFFGLVPNVAVMHQVVVAQLAHRRAGTQSTKGRAEVRGGGKKPFSQKGTGNARQGSIRAPQFVGGAVTLGPTPRKYSQRTPKKMVQLALRSALSDRARDGKVIVVDAWSFDKPNAKAGAAALAALGTSGNVMVVVKSATSDAAKSMRNLANVQVVLTSELNAYDVLVNDWIVFSSVNGVQAFVET